MTVNLPPTVRVALYVLTMLGAPVVAYARSKGYIGDLELVLWSGEVTAVSALAAFNVQSSDDEPLERDEVGQANTVLLIAVAALVLAVLAIAGWRL